MSLLRRLLFYLRRERFERELDEEMRFHLEMKVEEHVASGMRPDEARAAARREFGSRARLIESSRETWAFSIFDSLVQDVQLALRGLRARPGFTAVALVSLALGIGANSAVFTLVNGAFLRPLPISNPEELVSLANNADRRIFPTFSYPNYEDFRDRSSSFEGLVAYRFAPLNVSHDGISERMWGYLVTGNYFDVLGVAPAAGRLFTPEDDRLPGGHPVAVVTHRAWQGRFGGAPDVVGREVVVNGRSYTIIGVAPEGFDGTEIVAAPQLFLPMAMQAEVERGRPWLDDRTTEPLFVQGRLLPGVDLARARAEIESIAAELEREFPVENEAKRVSLSPAGLMTGMIRRGLLGFTGLLLAIVGFALLLMCVNLANLLLARADERRREIGMSLALGAGRGRLVRRLLTECLLLSLGGGLLGLVLASGLVRLVARFIPSPPGDVPLAYELHMDYRVLVFTFLASLAAGVLFALLPALKVTRVEPRDALKDERSGAVSRTWFFGNGLVLLQVALSLLLLVGSGLAIRGLERAQTLDLGFDPDGAVEVSFDARLSGYDEARGRELQKSLLDRMRALPGVRAAGIADFVPVDLHFARNRLFVEGAPVPERANQAPLALVSRVSPGFLAAMSTRLVKGRDFQESDDESAVRVAIVNETLARRFWPGQDPIGKRFSLGSSEAPLLSIVGVAENGKYAGLNEDPQPFVHVPIYQSYSGSMTVVARTDSEPELLLASLRAEVRELDPEIPLFDARTLRKRLALPLFPARIAASFLGGFALLSLCLAAVGIYGVTSQAMSRRRQEFGIRVALGARRGDVLGMAMRQGLLPAMVGVAFGLVLAWIATRFMTSVLFGLSPQDPSTFLATAFLLVLVAAVASFVPARSAASKSPMKALRSD
jgi:predicted permease